jgi:hypothetical protein
MSFYTKIDFNQAFIVKTPCSCVYRCDFLIFLCVEQREAPPPASCDIMKYALLQKPGVYPGPLKAQALDNSRWKSARFCKNDQNLTNTAARAISCFSRRKARDSARFLC